MLFNSQWIYFPSEEEMKSILTNLEKHYGQEGVDLFKNIVDHQKKWTKRLKKDIKIGGSNIKKISTHFIFNIPVYKKVKKIKDI